MSVERQRDVQVDVELGKNATRVTVTETCKVAGLFDESGELRLWEDDAGWSGYLLEDGQYFRVNTRHDEDDWVSKQPVKEYTAREGFERHIRDRDAGGVGVFRRKCSP